MMHALIAHLQAYVGLLVSEAQRSTRALAGRALLAMAAVCAFSTSVVLAGMAWMLWSLQPPGHSPPVALFLAPGLALCAALGCTWGATRGPVIQPFQRLQTEWQLDLAVLRGKESP